VAERITAPKDLVALMNASSNDSYFDWGPVIKQIGPLLSRNDLEEVAKAADKHNERPSLLAALSERATALKDSDYGWTLGERALAASPSYGWDRTMSGGRLTAFRALLKADSPRAREMAHSDLTRSLVSEFNYPQNIARNLLSILPLLSEEDLTVRVWEDLEPYIRRLFSNMGTFVEGPIFFYLL
jgi:hypothetical protein